MKNGHRSIGRSSACPSPVGPCLTISRRLTTNNLALFFAYRCSSLRNLYIGFFLCSYCDHTDVPPLMMGSGQIALETSRRSSSSGSFMLSDAEAFAIYASASLLCILTDVPPLFTSSEQTARDKPPLLVVGFVDFV